MVDDKKISLTPAYQIAALTEPEQHMLAELYLLFFPNLSALKSGGHLNSMRYVSKSTEYKLEILSPNLNI